MEQPHILVYGRDLELLRTRNWVLASVGYHMTEAVNFSEVEKALSDGPIDLLVLCHSLSERDCKQVEDRIRDKLRPKLIVLTAGPSAGLSRISAGMADAQQGPARLLVKVKRLLCLECSSIDTAKTRDGYARNI